MTVPTLNPVARISQIMDALVALEEEVHDDLIVYRWRPVSPQLDSGGALYNWIGPSPNQVIDTATWRDSLSIVTRIGIRHTDIEEDMERIEEYIDAFVLKFDAELDVIRPLGVRRASRQDMGMVEDSFNDIPVMAVQFLLNIERDKHITSKSFS